LLFLDFEIDQEINHINKQKKATTKNIGQNWIKTLIKLHNHIKIGHQILLLITESDQLNKDQL